MLVIYNNIDYNPRYRGGVLSLQLTPYALVKFGFSGMVNLSPFECRSLHVVASCHAAGWGGGLH